MSNFRTVLPLEKTNFDINYQSPILCIGSCFTENTGNLLVANKFPTLLNPFGILYNPISIKNSLEILLSEKEYTAKDLFFHQDLWRSFDHHSFFSATNQVQALETINHQIKVAKVFLQQTKRIILTFGTANVFINKSAGKVVANCHKLPTTNFEKQRLSVAEITSALLPVLQQLKTQNSTVEIILTLSPVRHIRDGLLENQRSKATLLLALEYLSKELPFTHYFPAYELVLDDLRDYRFFGKDMIHPNEIAIDYIWNYFQQTYFSTKTMAIFKQVKKIVQASQHRPLHPTTATHQQFVRKQLEKIIAFSKQYPFINLKTEQEIFQEQLIESK
ncbi:MAG: GSCFA domain-containing protein [Saprospiraceae bacterium]